MFFGGFNYHYVGGMINLLNAARIRDIEKIIFASSSAIYGDTPTLPKREDMPSKPISPYGVSKMAAESYLMVYNQVYGLDTTALRYFNVFGPRQKDSPYIGVIAIFISNIFQDTNPTIFGDGTQSRDFTYIKDVVSANILAADAKKASGKVFNIAAGKPITMNELTRYIIKLSNKQNIKIEYGPKRAGDILHSYGDIQLAKDVLGFTPEYDALTGFKEYIEYFKKKYYPNN